MSETNTMPCCATCKHWGRSQEPPYGLVNFSRSRYTDGYRSNGQRRCAAIQHDPSDTADKLAFTRDDEQYDSELVTAADFGCVLHESAGGEA